MTTQDQVIAILAEQAMLETSDVALDNSLDDLGIDSMSLVESIFAIEEAFDITVPFNANNPSESGASLECPLALSSQGRALSIRWVTM